MELTQKTFAARLNEIRRLLQEDQDAFERIAASLHEKGVECAIVVPVLEVLLEFDALTDVAYEQTSDVKHGQRFDFLLDGRFLVEAKTLGATLDDHRPQIARYIRDNDAINYGLLTNGVDYQIWLQKTYIEQIVGAPLQHADPVTKVLDLSLVDDSTQFLIEALSLLRKSTYQQSFQTMAAIAGYYGAGARGRPPNLHSDRQINETLRDRIRSAVSVTKGVYYDDVQEGKIHAGDRLEYKDNCVQIAVEVTTTGTVILRKGAANILDMVAAMEEGWMPMIQLIAQSWSKSDAEFEDPIEIIKRALNKQRLYGKERYVFGPVQ